MTLYTIITNDRPVAVVNDDRIVERLNGSDSVLCDTLRCVKTTSGKNLWDGVSGYTTKSLTLHVSTGRQAGLADADTHTMAGLLCCIMQTLAAYTNKPTHRQTAARYRLRHAASLARLHS